MSLCYDFQKWTIISLAGIAISLTVGLVILVLEANGQLDSKYMNEDEVQMILLYCYQHADRPNPVQDLIDKGFVSAEFAGDTCISVKQGHNNAKEAIHNEAVNATYAFSNCRENETASDCSDIIRDYCDNPTYAQWMHAACNLLE